MTWHPHKRECVFQPLLAGPAGWLASIRSTPCHLIKHRMRLKETPSDVEILQQSANGAARQEARG